MPIHHAVRTYRRPGQRRTCLSGSIIVIVGTHEKLHAQPIRKILHLLHLRKMAAPTPLRSHPLWQACIFHLRRPQTLVRARHTHGGISLAGGRGALVHQNKSMPGFIEGHDEKWRETVAGENGGTKKGGKRWREKMTGQS